MTAWGQRRNAENPYRARIDAAVEAHRDVQRSLRASMADRDRLQDVPRATSVGGTRRILRTVTDSDDRPGDPPEAAVAEPTPARRSTWLT